MSQVTQSYALCDSHATLGKSDGEIDTDYWNNPMTEEKQSKEVARFMPIAFGKNWKALAHFFSSFNSYKVK